MYISNGKAGYRKSGAIYQAGNFPVTFPWTWTEYNGKYRDTVGFCRKGEGGKISDFAHWLTGSSDL